MNSADVLLHPTRLRIIQAFLGDRALTTAELGAELPDIPPASLYRHVNLLFKHGALAIAAERRVRGAVERTYVLRPAASTITDQELAQMSPDQHRAAFMAYVAGLLGEFDAYLERGDINMRRDGVGYRIGAMWLDDAEFEELLRELIAVLQPRLALAPKPGRARRIIASVFLRG